MPDEIAVETVPNSSEGRRAVPETLVRARLATAEGPRDALIYATLSSDVSPASRIVAIDAATGSLLWFAEDTPGAGRLGAISAPPAILLDALGVAYRAYVGDGAGQIWRIDLRANVKNSRLRLLAEPGVSTGDITRLSFETTPDVVRGFDAAGRPYDGVVLTGRVDSGIGPRLELFFLRDEVTSSERGEDRSGESSILLSHLCDIEACSEAGGGCRDSGAKGWRRSLGTARGPEGELRLLAPLIDGGRVFVTAASANTDDCQSPDAQRRLFLIDVATGCPLLPGLNSIDLGRGDARDPEIIDGRIAIPGLIERLPELNLPSGFLRAERLRPRRLYRLDLLLDADP